MDTKELIKMIISERVGYYFRQNRNSGIREAQLSGEFQKLLKDRNPDLLGEFERYLDSVAGLEAADRESIYLFGVRDGMRLMRDIISTN